MSTDIVAMLLDKDLSHSKVTVVKEVNGCDSSFIISCLIGHQIRSKFPLLLTTCHNTLSHYQNVGFKMNYNLKKSIESKQTVFYNLGEDTTNNLLQGKMITLQDIMSKIKEMAKDILEKHTSFHLIFDGISHLFDLQYSLIEVNRFLKELIVLGRQSNSDIFFQCSVANEDDVTSNMSNILSHMAHVVVDVVNLPTGLSADVSGHLIVKKIGQKFQPEYMSNINIKSTMYHFKLFDKGVKLFAPGIV